jgi:hypothetical protein
VAVADSVSLGIGVCVGVSVDDSWTASDPPDIVVDSGSVSDPVAATIGGAVLRSTSRMTTRTSGNRGSRREGIYYQIR